MVRHVVMWKLKPEASATPEILDANIRRQREFYNQIQSEVPELIKLAVFRSFHQGDDFCEFMAVMDFDSWEGLHTFRCSPAHTDPVKRAFAHSIRAWRAVVDYEI